MHTFTMDARTLKIALQTVLKFTDVWPGPIPYVYVACSALDQKIVFSATDRYVVGAVTHQFKERHDFRAPGDENNFRLVLSESSVKALIRMLGPGDITVELSDSMFKVRAGTDGVFEVTLADFKYPKLNHLFTRPLIQEVKGETFGINPAVFGKVIEAARLLGARDMSTELLQPGNPGRFYAGGGKKYAYDLTLHGILMNPRVSEKAMSDLMADLSLELLP